jgi:hypothetical protein
VLRPDGELRFLEHVRADGGALAHAQDAIAPLWRAVAAGCHPNRRTAEVLVAAGFRLIEFHTRRVPPTWSPVSPVVWGVAKRT